MSRQATMTSPSSFPRRIAFGTASRVRPDFSRQTLVFQVAPSTVAITGMRPQAPAVTGANSSGTGANTQPPGSWMRKRVEEKDAS